MKTKKQLRKVLHRVDQLLALMQQTEAHPTRLAQLQPPDWSAAVAFLGRRQQGTLQLSPVMTLPRIQLDDLQDIEVQKTTVEQNTRQFLNGYPANHVLLSGARGCGKSSLVNALLNKYAVDGLRLVQLERDDLRLLDSLVDMLKERPERFIIFCDDLSFQAHESGYQALKSVLDGSVVTLPDNILLYATSNRRHLVPEHYADNAGTEEIHPREAVEEKISLSDRFGVWVSFYPFSQDEYLNIVMHWLAYYQVSSAQQPAVREAALQWALQRGARSGRVAWQFARDFAGQQALAARR